MRCKHAKLMISVSVDGGLSQREQLALDRHLARCPECARDEAGLAHLRDAMALWADEEPSPWLAENFAHRLKVQQEESKQVVVRRPRWLVGTAAAGVATALLAFGIIVTHQLQAPPAQPTSRDETVVVTQPSAEKAGPAATQPVNAPRAERAPAMSPGGIRVEEPMKAAPPDRRTLVSKRPRNGENASPRPPVGNRRPRNGSRGAGLLASRGGMAPSEAERMILKNIVAAGIANESATDAMTNELGAAALVVNETVEMVRGTLREAADMLAASHAAPVIEDSESVYLDRGGIL